MSQAEDLREMDETEDLHKGVTEDVFDDNQEDDPVAALIEDEDDVDIPAHEEESERPEIAIDAPPVNENTSGKQKGLPKVVIIGISVLFAIVLVLVGGVLYLQSQQNTNVNAGISALDTQALPKMPVSTVQPEPESTNSVNNTAGITLPMSNAVSKDIEMTQNTVIAPGQETAQTHSVSTENKDFIAPDPLSSASVTSDHLTQAQPSNNTVSTNQRMQSNPIPDKAKADTQLVSNEPSLNAQNEKLLADNVAMANQIEALLAEIKTLESKVDTLTHEKERLNKRYKSARHKNKLYAREVGVLKKRLAKLTSADKSGSATTKPLVAGKIEGWTLKGVTTGKALFANKNGKTVVVVKGDIISGQKIEAIDSVKLAVKTPSGTIYLSQK